MKKSKKIYSLDELTKQAHLIGEELSHFDEAFEVSDLEAADMLEEFEEHAERFGRTKGVLRGRAIASKTMQKKYGRRWTAASKKSVMSPSSRAAKVGGKISNTFVNITIKRLTSNIAFSLPFAVFGHLALASNYQQALAEYLPVGVTISSVGLLSTGGYVIRFTDGIATDMIEINCTQIGYAEFVKALATDQFEVTRIRYSLDTAAHITQYQEPFALYTKSLFGTKQVKDFPIEMHKSPMQQQALILDIDQSFSVDKEQVIIGKIINDVVAATPVQLQLNFFISNYFKYNAKTILG